MSNSILSDSDPEFKPSLQLSLFTPQFNNRIRRAIYKGTEVFSLVDLMAEFSDLESRPDVLWKRTRERLTKDGIQLDQAVIKLALRARDGKMRQTECANGLMCLRIIQSIPSEKAEPVRMWFAELGYRQIEERNNPGLGTLRAKERDLGLLKARGYSSTEALKYLETRVDSMSTYKSLMATVFQVCEKPRPGEIVNAEYLALFGEIAERLKIILNTESVRDALPRLQLAYLRTAEESLQSILKGKDRIQMKDILFLVDEIVVPLGAMLAKVCQMQGVHHITGQALIKAGVK